jgi:release factor glutamine methyltransferase
MKLDNPINLVKHGSRMLSETGWIQNPQKEAEFLFWELYNQPHWLIEENIPKEDCTKYIEYINKRRSSFPIQYITGKAYFDSDTYEVGRGVFIPRQDTEILLEESARVYNGGAILDICTGVGNICIGLAKRFKNTKVFATDISEGALTFAKKNANRILGNHNINWIQTDMWKQISNCEFSLIVSNPPYLSKQDLLCIPDDVKKEPVLALYGGEEGLDFIDKIIRQGWKLLKNKGCILIEIGDKHKDRVLDIVKTTGKYREFRTLKNLAGIDRIVCINM